MSRVFFIFILLWVSPIFASIDPLTVEAMVGETVILERADGATYTGLLKMVKNQKAVMVLADGRVVTVSVDEIEKVFINAGASLNVRDSTPTGPAPQAQVPTATKMHSPIDSKTESAHQESRPIAGEHPFNPPEGSFAPFANLSDQRLRSATALFLTYEPDSGLDYLIGVGLGGSQAVGPILSQTAPIYPVLATDVRFTYGYVEGENTETEVSMVSVSAGAGVGYVTPDLCLSASLLYGFSSAKSTTWIWGLPDGSEQEISGEGDSSGGMFSLDFRYKSLYLGLDVGFEGGSNLSVGVAF